jgi:hypothetical protein
VIIPEPASASLDRSSDYLVLAPQQEYLIIDPPSSVAARSDSPSASENPVMADYLVIVPSEISG